MDKYYYDTDLGTYKLCSYKMDYFKNCLFNDYFICSKCQTSFALKRENNVECAEESSLISYNHFYTNDSGINYYSCKCHNDVNNGDECQNSNTCDECVTDYELYNNNKLCAKQADIENNLYIVGNGDLLIACSSLIEDCNSCREADNCLTCQDGVGLTENNNCISVATVEEKHDYFKDENTNKFINCLTLENYITCISSSVCTSPQEGFTLENNQCTKNEEKKDDDGLSRFGLKNWPNTAWA